MHRERSRKDAELDLTKQQLQDVRWQYEEVMQKGINYDKVQDMFTASESQKERLQQVNETLSYKLESVSGDHVW